MSDVDEDGGGESENVGSSRLAEGRACEQGMTTRPLFSVAVLFQATRAREEAIAVMAAERDDARDADVTVRSPRGLRLEFQDRSQIPTTTSVAPSPSSFSTYSSSR